ncbi:oligosaccharide flippase family protein [Flavobacterium hiemivividum]|uniref:Polysaccharide biosynthesis protein n=1 Tax=Flavobacterium hiemivividum TaxID=2541734 RepID=A0A4R5CXP0_9FLAO|nr:oligosaccharide flippase family protein [Flavobacterium hiemivividum]TDE04547.1 polysaccharide biosynthesis protein [Flavobacterium hiemivividum]
MSDNGQSYKTIFKSTFLFGFVQVFNILARVGVNKAVAVFLGAEGLGLVNLYQSTINLITTASGLGISQSAIRDISEVNGVGDRVQFSRTINITNRFIWITALLGSLITLLLSKYLSILTFGNDNYAISFMWLSIVVFLNILCEGQLAILKGLRQLKAIAKAGVFGSIFGLITAVPIYYYLGYDGIVPSLIITVFSSVFFLWLYVKKIKIETVNITFRELVHEGTGMVKMGIALMYVTLLGLITDYIIRIYIEGVSGLQMVGLFAAGSTIVSSYFGIVITAMSTDYYPRISAINKNNLKLTDEVNKQSEVGLVLIGPLVVLFLFVMPLLIKILYTDKFLEVIDYISYAVFGTLILVCSTAMGMILLAKQKSSVFIYSVTFSKVIGVVLSIFSFKYFGLMGLGISSIIMAVIHMLLMQLIMYKLFEITFKKELLEILFVTIIFSLISFFIKDFTYVYLRYGLGTIIFISSLCYSIRKINKIMNINIVEMTRSKFKI